MFTVFTQYVGVQDFRSFKTWLTQDSIQRNFGSLPRFIEMILFTHGKFLPLEIRSRGLQVGKPAVPQFDQPFKHVIDHIRLERFFIELFKNGQNGFPRVVGRFHEG